MAGEASVTVTGNLIGDPELVLTPGGSAVVTLTIASTPRSFDAQVHKWAEGEMLFLPARVRGQSAGHAAASLAQGMRVIATGVLTSRTYRLGTGEQRTVTELDVEEIAPSLRHVTAAVTCSGAGPGEDSAPHPADRFVISGREYVDNDLWFGLAANPEGRINTTAQEVPGA